jgi:hypothetical protein
MGKTKRFYNYPNRVFSFWHPWHQICTGHCDACGDPMVSKRRRLSYKYELRKELKMFELKEVSI